MNDEIERAKAHFEEIIKEQKARIDRLKKEKDWIDYSTLHPIIIGIIAGDGIGPFITAHAKNVL
ncbi:MAG: isocitrate/isopropylmalate dehydrogenase family protein, partial [Promethearchaeota archaeon]